MQSPVPGMNPDFGRAMCSRGLRHMRGDRSEERTRPLRSRSQPRSALHSATKAVEGFEATEARRIARRSSSSRTPRSKSVEAFDDRRMSRSSASSRTSRGSRSPFRDPARNDDNRKENTGNIAVERIYTYRVSDHDRITSLGTQGDFDAPLVTCHGILV